MCTALDNESIEENLRTICFCGDFFKWHIPTSTPETALDACSQNFQVSTLYRVEGGRTDISFRKGCTVLLRHPNLQEIMNIAPLSQGPLPRIVNKKAHFFSIIHLITKRHWPHSIVYTPTNQNIPMNRFFLQSWFKIILLWICAFRLQISQSVQLSKVAIFLSKVHTLCIPSKL